MVRVMSPSVVICQLSSLLLCSSLCGLVITTAADDYVTQTVYGFLDFTTTIGNTVMVFSPQSAAMPENDGSKDKATESAINAVIETKPTESQQQQPPPTIKPSKTITNEEERPPSERPKEISTIVNVQSKSPLTAASPANSAPLSSSSKVNVVLGMSSVVNVLPAVSTKVQVVIGNSVVKPSSKVEVVRQPPIVTSVITSSSSSDEETSVPEPAALVVGNNIFGGEPEYDFLSRQPSEVVEETYKVVNLKQNTKHHPKPHHAANTKLSNKGTGHHQATPRPTGLVTKLGGTVIKDGVTTVHETSVIGTYISGKYAQVLQSTSHVSHPKGRINPSPSLRILKTNAPIINKHGKQSLESLSSEESSYSVESSHHPQTTGSKGSKKQSGGHGKRPKGGKSQQQQQHHEVVESPPKSSGPSQSSSFKKNNKSFQSQQPVSSQPRSSGFSKQHTTQAPPPSHRSHKSSNKKGKKNSRSSVSVHSEPPPTSPPPSNQQQPGGRKFNRKHKSSKAPPPPPPPTSPSFETSVASGFQRKSFKSRPSNNQQNQQHHHQNHYQSSNTQQSTQENPSNFKLKLNRAPGRWQYKTSPKPRVTIRKQQGEEQHQSPTTPLSSSGDISQPQQHHRLNDPLNGAGSSSSPSNNHHHQARSSSDEADGLDSSESIASITGEASSQENKIDNPFPLETIKVEISTPPDFKDTYYEIATIKSPYTFQVGSVKNTRYITVTSTFEKLLDSTATENNAINPTKVTEPLTENILATSNNYEKDHNFLDSSIATLPPLYMASDVATPPLETKTETFSTTQTMLKTHILPAVRYQNETSSYTLVQTYLVTRLVTATKTLPPMEAYHFNPSKILNEFNSHLDEAGSELNLELAFGDENDNDGESRTKKIFPADLDLAQIGSDFDLSQVDKSNLAMEMHLRSKKAHGPATSPKLHLNDQLTPNLSPEQLQQLALLRLLNPAAGIQQQQVITTSRPVIKVDTVYESHVLPITNGRLTYLTTISKSKGIITKTDYEFGTSTIQPQLPNIPNLPIAPYFPPPQQQFAVTSSPLVQTTQITQTNSQILKLTFGAKTVQTTIFSTTLVPTVLTTYLTQSVAVQPTAAFPGYFPNPYAPFPYVG